jgi:DNA-binding transcriptional regulator YhcF (GntR family)
MSERGVFAVDRGVFDHPMFAPEPFTEREAWMWLVGLAAYRACQRRIGSAVVELKRGQAAASVRYLADKWQWKAPRVQRFLARLKKEGMIDTAADTGVTVISINNYSKYQKVALPTDTPNEQAADTAAIQQRYKEERNKTNKQDSEEPSGSSADAEPVGEDDKTRLFRSEKQSS